MIKSVVMASASSAWAMLFLPRHEPGIITTVEEDHAMQFIALNNSPAPSLRRVHLGVSIPGPFDGWHAIPCRQTAVHLAVDVAKVKVAMTFVSELDIPFFLLIDVLLVPLFHRNDSPSSGKRVLGFAFLTGGIKTSH